MKSVITWVLLADKSFARILENRGPGEGLHQPRDCTYTASERLAYSDDEGRTQGSMSKSRLRLDKHVENAPEAEQFARELVATLDIEHRRKRFDRLVISASPGMLGLLRSMLTYDLKKILKVELNKELARTPTDDVAKHFANTLKF